MVPESQLRNTSVDPLVALSSYGQSNQSLAEAGGVPTVDEIAEGVKGSLKTIMSLAVSVAESVPTLSEKMKLIRQTALESTLTVQSMAESGSEGGGY